MSIEDNAVSKAQLPLDIQKKNSSCGSCFAVVVIAILVLTACLSLWERFVGNRVYSDDKVKELIEGSWALHAAPDCQLTFFSDNKVTYEGSSYRRGLFHLYFKKENGDVALKEYEESVAAKESLYKKPIKATGIYEVRHMWILIRWDRIDDVFINPEEKFPHASFVGGALPFENRSIGSFDKVE